MRQLDKTGEIFFIDPKPILVKDHIDKVEIYKTNFNDHSLTLNCSGLTEFEELPDGEMYVNTLNKVQFFSLQRNDFRLYFNDKKNYLLFNYHLGCCGTKCEDTQTICLNEYMTTQIIPEIVSHNSINKWIVENHTTTEIYIPLYKSITKEKQEGIE